LRRIAQVFLNIFIVATDQTLAVEMSDTASLILNFKTGVLKELHRRQLISKEELEKAIKAIASEKI